MPESASEQAASVCKETITISTYPPGPADRNPMLKEHLDGRVAVWMGDHGLLGQIGGMVGIRLYPGKAYVAFKVRRYNRVSLPHSFFWWVNLAAHWHLKEIERS